MLTENFFFTRRAAVLMLVYVCCFAKQQQQTFLTRIMISICSAPAQKFSQNVAQMLSKLYVCASNSLLAQYNVNIIISQLDMNGCHDI